MSVSFFSPIYPSEIHNENLGFLRSAISIFDFGQQSYKIEVFTGDTSLYLSPHEDSKPTWMGTLARIAAILTVIIPLLALIGIAIYRLANQFKVLNTFSALPEEVQKVICGFAPIDCGALAKVNKQINTFMHKDLALKKNWIISEAVEECLKTVELMTCNKQAVKALCQIAEFLIPLDKTRATEIIKSALEKAILSPEPGNEEVIRIWVALDLYKGHQHQMSSYAAYAAIARAKENVENALEMADQIPNIEHQFIALKGIVEFLIPKDPAKALEVANRAAALNFAGQRSKYIKEIIEVYFSKHDRERALELANTIFESDKDFAIAYIARESELEEALRLANTIDDRFNRSFALCEIAKKLKEDNFNRGQEIANLALEAARTVTDPFAKEEAFAYSAGTMGLFNLENALRIVSGMSDVFLFSQKSRAYTNIAHAIHTTNMKEATRLAGIAFNEAKEIKCEKNALNENNPMAGRRFDTFLNIAMAFAS